MEQTPKCKSSVATFKNKLQSTSAARRQKIEDISNLLITENLEAFQELAK